MKTINTLILILSISFLFGCKRDVNQVSSIGPNYITTEEAFVVSSNPGNFALGNIHFNAKLTSVALWKIEVKGLTTGAIKRFSSTSQFIDASNTDWDSSSDTTLAFASEPCMATLYIPSSKVTKILYFDVVVYTGPFAITQALAINSDPVNFNSNAYFTSKFSNVKNWVLTITGTTSGAIKRITGSSIGLNAANSKWDGSSDTAFFFKAESCQATISFPGSAVNQSINFTISTPKAHPGYLINDFEGAAFGSYLGSNNGTYFDTPDQATSIIDLYSFNPSPQGNKVLRFDCNDVNSSYYTGGVYHNSLASTYGIPSMSADSLYLNLFIYGYSGGNASLSIEIKESDGDRWQPAQISVNWTGWKLVSLKFSQMSNTSGTGNITRESNKLNSVNISMNSIPQGLNCKALVDYVIFTKAPLKP